jgi:RNA polymerase sigma-70 factor, ECF subfamily
VSRSTPAALTASPEGNSLAAIVADERAFRAWYEATLPRVYGYLFQRCGRDRDLAEELTQQTFVEALRSHARWDGRDPVNWLIGIARHRLIDYLRGRERRERGLLRLFSLGQPQVTWVGPTEPDDALSAALANLPATQRAAITLRYVDDLPVREVARLLGRSESAVESLLSRGRDSLRRQYAEVAR